MKLSHLAHTTSMPEKARSAKQGDKSYRGRLWNRDKAIKQQCSTDESGGPSPNRELPDR